MSRSEAAVLLKLAESIADGSPIDWEAAEASASHEEKAVIRELRILSSLAVLHRSLQTESMGPGSAFVRRDSAAPAIGNWAHLTLIERLGGGASGDVYRAWDRHLEREVALKLLRVETSTGDLATSKIANEGRLLARIKHQNVITVHGVDAHDNRVGLWMDLVRGATLEQQLGTRGPFSAREAAAIGIDLCRALAAIHGAGLIHRDVKAQNVMREDGGRIVLMDLGTGRDADRGVPGGVPELAGTPLYLAPEIFTGSPAGARTDIYSLGVLLYHLVTGTFPVRAVTIDELQAGHAKGSAVRLRDARADLPTAFVRVVDRAIARDPETRYQSAGELEADLADAISETAKRADREVRPGRFRLTSWPVVAAAAAAVVIVGGWPALRRSTASRMALAPRDTILIAGFTNRTGDAVFDGTLKDALAVELQQSPYLNAVRGVSDIPEGTSASDASGGGARALCRRLGMKATVLGSIASAGGRYTVSVAANDCETGSQIAASQADAPTRTGVLQAVGVATAALREQLGESRPSIQQFNVPVDAATTSSLDALKAYSVGMDTRARKGEAEAIPFFNHAIELDPRFALAEGRLAAIYANLHEFEQSQAHTKKAFDLSDHVTERERLYIRGSYHHHVTGRLDEAIGAYRLWTEMYPQDWMPYHNLGMIARRVGQFDEAVLEVEKARTMKPDQVIPYEELGRTYIAMGKFDDARSTIRLAQSRGLDGASNHVMLLQLALVDGGLDAERRQFATLSDGTRDYIVLQAAARAEAFGGDFAASRSLVAQAAAKARAGGMDAFASSLIAEDALNAALTGDGKYAEQTIGRAIEMSRGSETLWAASLAHGLSGRRATADQLAADYRHNTAPTADVVAVFGPVLQAASALGARDFAGALDALQSAAPYERIGRFWPAYIRGRAYVGLKRYAEANAQFESILAHRGDDVTGVLYPLASLELARSRRSMGDVRGAREAYDMFTTAWRSAPATTPTLAAAVRERSKLPR